MLLCKLALMGRVIDRSSPNNVVAREGLEAGAHNLLNRADTITMEGNLRIRSYSHIHANRSVTATANPRRGIGTTKVREL
jgi:hypothetical protein